MKNYKYGIFKASCEIRTKNVDHDRLTKTDDLWDVVSRDENIGAPIETFETEEEAKKALDTYTSDERIDSYNGFHYLTYNVYFVAELELYDEDREGELEAYVNGDGVDIAPLPKQE